MISDTALGVMTRAEAIAFGSRRYFTGKPCKHGHIAERHVATRNCIICQRRRTIAWTKEWRRRTNSPSTASVRIWRRRNPDAWAASQGRALAVKRGAVIGETYTPATCISFYAEARRLSRETGVAHQVDHIVPLSKGGKHEAGNLQVLTAWENNSKGDLCVT